MVSARSSSATARSCVSGSRRKSSGVAMASRSGVLTGTAEGVLAGRATIPAALRAGHRAWGRAGQNRPACLTAAGGRTARAAARARGGEDVPPRTHGSVRQRIGPDLDMHGTGLRALAAFLEPWRAVAVGAPQAAALPAGVRIVDAPVQAFREEA